MDCHRCIYIKYDGCRYGRCTHPGHLDVRLVARGKRKDGDSRPYNKQICREFKLRKKCSNCKHWIRGEYFADGSTPARKGKCSLRVIERGGDCHLWKRGPTSWRKRRGSSSEVSNG